MSLKVKTVDGEVTAQFMGIPIAGVSIGKHEISLEHFCVMAVHFLGGGLCGWGNETPECVNKALSYLSNLYTSDEAGKWTRKTVEELAAEADPEKK